MDPRRLWYHIVNPGATAEEVEQVVNSGSEVQVFAQATMGSRFAQSQNVYSEVQKRHEDIKKIERTISELAQMMNDVSNITTQCFEPLVMPDVSIAKLSCRAARGCR